MKKWRFRPVVRCRERNRRLPCCRNCSVAETPKRLKATELNRGPGKRPDRPTIERPQCKPSRFFMKPIRLMFAVTLLVAAACSAFYPALPALAADPIFPAGSRVGLTPLVGLSRAKGFVGFETEDKSVKVLVAELPADAYGEVAN